MPFMAGFAVMILTDLQQARSQDVPGSRSRSDVRPADEIGERFMVYDDRVNHFIPGGYMPDGRGIRLDLKCEEAPFAGNSCIRISYRLADNPWIGVAFLLDNQWEPKRTFNLYEALGARPGDPIVLRFYVRSADRATAKFKVGGMKRDAQALPIETPWTTIGGWQFLEVDLTDADLSSLHGALIVVLDREHNAGSVKPVIQMDLDQIYFTRTKSRPR
jgi:hypothetical protein